MCDFTSALFPNLTHSTVCFLSHFCRKYYYMSPLDRFASVQQCTNLRVKSSRYVVYATLEFFLLIVCKNRKEYIRTELNKRLQIIYEG